jgi:hypothetical protein
MIVLPANPVEVGSLSSAGISSFLTYLSGNSIAISNSIGTMFSPRTRRVRPVATTVCTAASFSPPIALRASPRICAARSIDAGEGGGC